MNNWLQLLGKDLPIEPKLGNDLTSLLIITIFPPLFIILIQPSAIFNGFDQSNVIGWFALSGFGLVSGIVSLICSILIPMIFPAVFERMVVWTAALYYLSFFLLLATANYIYKSFWKELLIFHGPAIRSAKIHMLDWLFPTLLSYFGDSNTT